MIDSDFHPPNVVMFLIKKNLIPSPAEEIMYLLHFETSSLLMYSWWPDLWSKITFQWGQQKSSFLRPYFDGSLLPARNNQFLRLVKEYIVQGTVAFGVFVHGVAKDSFEKGEVSHKCVTFVFVLVYVFQQIQRIQFKVIFRSTHFPSLLAINQVSKPTCLGRSLYVK